MFTRIATVGAISAGLTLKLNRRTASCNSANNYIFDTRVSSFSFVIDNGLLVCIQGIPANLPTSHITDVSSPLHLVGVGMRRKFLIIAEFDVYLVGVALSPEALKKASEWANAPEDSRKPLSTYVLAADKPAPNAKPSIPRGVKAGVMIHMVRGATKSQFVEAFREAFQGISDEHFHSFQPLLEDCMGDKGMQAKDEMGFFFMNDGTLVLAKNGQVKGSLKIDDINVRLLDIYSDPKRSVSKELSTSVAQNLPKVLAQYGK